MQFNSALGPYKGIDLKIIRTHNETYYGNVRWP